MENRCPGSDRCGCPVASPALVLLDRRTFLMQGAISAAMLALAACASDATGPDFGPSISNPVVLADHPELANTGGMLLGSLNDAPIAIVRTGSASFVALSRICPHQGGTIGASGSGFMCPVHGARFTASGAWNGGQPTTNMRSYAVSYDAVAGTVTIG